MQKHFLNYCNFITTNTWRTKWEEGGLGKTGWRGLVSSVILLLACFPDYVYCILIIYNIHHCSMTCTNLNIIPACCLHHCYLCDEPKLSNSTIWSSTTTSTCLVAIWFHWFDRCTLVICLSKVAVLHKILAVEKQWYKIVIVCICNFTTICLSWN